MNRSADTAAAWVYEGIWRALVRWFALPQHPPDLPVRAGETVERFHPAPGFLRYLKFWFWIGLTAFDGLLLIGWVASFFANVVLGLILAPVFFAVAILPDIVVYIGLHLRYDTTWYVLSPRSLRIRRGIWVLRETTITYENVQNVKIHQGPLQRYYGIADLVVETAGGGASHTEEGTPIQNMHVGMIEGVADAGGIRDLIMDRVRRSRAGGLGDEWHERRPAAAASPGLLWTPEHVAVLAKIQNELAQTRAALSRSR